jgi:hypothetical protein
MKWSDRITQGFNPGLPGNKGALKVAPECLGENGGSTGEEPNHARRSPLSGRALVASYPGLKPWAVLSDHFTVTRLSTFLKNMRRNTESLARLFLIPLCRNLS